MMMMSENERRQCDAARLRAEAWFSEHVLERKARATEMVNEFATQLANLDDVVEQVRRETPWLK